MTECAPVISTNLSWHNKVGSVGKLMPNCEAKTVDDELWVKGSSVMQGYYHMPQETADTLEDGWLKTGDLPVVRYRGSALQFQRQIQRASGVDRLSAGIFRGSGRPQLGYVGRADPECLKMDV